MKNGFFSFFMPRRSLIYPKLVQVERTAKFIHPQKPPIDTNYHYFSLFFQDIIMHFYLESSQNSTTNDQFKYIKKTLIDYISITFENLIYIF